MTIAASRARKVRRGAAFVEALLATVALAAVVGVGLLCVERWALAARRFDERAEAFAVAFSGCGRTTDLAATLAAAWRTGDPSAFTSRQATRRVSTKSSSESFACNERGFLDERRLRREVARRLPGAK